MSCTDAVVYDLHIFVIDTVVNDFDCKVDCIILAVVLAESSHSVFYPNDVVVTITIFASRKLRVGG